MGITGRFFGVLMVVVCVGSYHKIRPPKSGARTFAMADQKVLTSRLCNYILMHLLHAENYSIRRTVLVRIGYQLHLSYLKTNNGNDPEIGLHNCINLHLQHAVII